MRVGLSNQPGPHPAAPDTSHEVGKSPSELEYVPNVAPKRQIFTRC